MQMLRFFFCSGDDVDAADDKLQCVKSPFTGALLSDFATLKGGEMK